MHSLYKEGSKELRTYELILDSKQPWEAGAILSILYNWKKAQRCSLTCPKHKAGECTTGIWSHAVELQGPGLNHCSLLPLSNVHQNASERGKAHVTLCYVLVTAVCVCTGGCKVERISYCRSWQKKFEYPNAKCSFPLEPASERAFKTSCGSQGTY